MPHANLQLAQELFEAVAARDLARLLELTDPEVELHSFFALGEEAGFYRGHSGLERYVSDLTDAFEIIDPTIEGGVGLGAVALLVGRVRIRGRGSGAEDESAAGWVVKFRDGKMLRFRAFRDPERVLEAAGLTEATPTPPSSMEIVRQVFDAASRRDTPTVFSLYDRDIEWDASRTTRGMMAGRVAKGHEALLGWLHEWYDVWSSVDDVLEELTSIDEHRIAVVMVQRGRGKASGVDVENRLWGIWTIREGKVVKVVWYPSRVEALAAAGLAA